MDRVAHSDQVGAAVRTIAELCWAFYDALITQGFTELQAERFTHLWLVETLKQTGGL